MLNVNKQLEETKNSLQVILIVLVFFFFDKFVECLVLFLRDLSEISWQGGRGGGNFKFGFGNEVTHPCNGHEIC